MEQNKNTDNRFLNGFSLFDRKDQDADFIICRGSISAKALMNWLIWNMDDFKNKRGYIPIQILKRKDDSGKLNVIVNDFALKNEGEKVTSSEHSPDREIDLS
mgnify:CR=1 FL=1|jgi:hypothetical protein|tara:strand:+ start:365 stop:670 length:306 start_codon:yes stop_codon:yes gene_type:complete